MGLTTNSVKITVCLLAILFQIAEPPLKFEDIVNTETYDKMRPPKPGGEFFLNLSNIQWRNWKQNPKYNETKFVQSISLH